MVVNRSSSDGASREGDIYDVGGGSILDRVGSNRGTASRLLRLAGRLAGRLVASALARSNDESRSSGGGDGHSVLGEGLWADRCGGEDSGGLGGVLLGASGLHWGRAAGHPGRRRGGRLRKVRNRESCAEAGRCVCACGRVRRGLAVYSRSNWADR